MGGTEFNWQDFELTQELQVQANSLALRARQGDRDARNDLFAALAFKVDRFVAQAARRRLPPGMDLDDLKQEAYLVFVELLEDWERGNFLAFFLGFFPWRLRHKAERLGHYWLKDRVEFVDHWAVSEALSQIGRTEEIESQVMLKETIACLPPEFRQVVWLHGIWRLPFREVAARQGTCINTAQNRWRRAVILLAAALQVDDLTAPPIRQSGEVGAAAGNSPGPSATS